MQITTRQQEQFNQMLATLKVIGKQYDTPAKLRRSAKAMGLGYDEALEMAYENIKDAAKSVIRGVKPLV